MKSINNFKGEKEIYEFWEKKNLFSADPKSKKKPFSLLIPPPNLTGELHLGHAMQHSILDAIARYKRLQGFDVLLLPGVDHAGIQFEAILDKKLAKENLSKKKLGREKWLEKAWEFKEEIYKSVSDSWRMMGLCADWSREVFTLDPGPQRAVFEQFKNYYEKGLVYKGPYIVQWCPNDKTAIEDVEVEYEERVEKLYFVKYEIRQKPGEFITIATTRPETIFADCGIAIFPSHPKFSQYANMQAINPLTRNPMPIFEDNRVDKNFGSGALKITPGHDFLDFEIGRDHDLPTVHVIDKNGRMTRSASFVNEKGSEVVDLSGQKASDTRDAVVAILEKIGVLERSRAYKHSVPVCERCKTTVEPLISEEWFVKVFEMAHEAAKIIWANKIKFLPKNYAKVISQWLENAHDWCISRSLWWGHRIPVWYSAEQNSQIKISLESPGKGWKQDEQVLDTWFSSGLWPLSTLGWPSFATSFAKAIKVKKATEGKPTSQKLGLDPQLAKYFPWDFEISAGEIKYLWIARMIMICQYLTDQIPFKTMFFHGMLRDLQGRKFSKSLGNGIEPQYLIDRWGVDATRMALYTYSIPGRDGRVSREILDERGKNYRNFATKIRNIARFIFDLRPKKIKQTLDFENGEDRWIKEEFDKALKVVTSHIERIELHLAIEEIYDFVWHVFADKFIEMAKTRRGEAQPVLEYILRNTMIVLHPFMPFLTEEIYQRFDNRKESIMLENWPV